MRTLRRLKFMSSPSLSDLGKREQAALDERGTQQRRACSNATWNSIHNGVIAVFQRKGLPDHELYNLNEGVRQLLKTELGSFFTEYLQNQLLTKGMVILRDKIRFYEGQKLLDTLAETWDFFFSDVLPMLQAIFYPVQGKEPSVRQLALLHFRNIITLNIKLEDALSRSRARVPPSIIQMLLILQGVHESKGATEDYLKLESLIQKVVSPYLGTYGLYSSDGPFTHSSCILEKRFFRRSKSGDILAKNPVVRSKSYNNPLLTPVAEYEYGCQWNRHPKALCFGNDLLPGAPGVLQPHHHHGQRLQELHDSHKKLAVRRSGEAQHRVSAMLQQTQHS
ncbi:proline rich 5 (renal) [Columba livia]|uniref:Proline rich 5 (Renal) n=1 Tax=Columba livia TaxID=8932 RepID=A0A2I0MKN9_COLLI|nr:proline rich 5 (renal) [Columba livia]